MKNLLLACVDAKGGNVDEYFEKWNDILDIVGEEDAVQERFFRQNYNAFRRFLNAPFVTDDRLLPLGPIATRSTMLDIYERLVKRDPFQFVEELRTSAEAYGKILLTNTDGLSSRVKRSFKDLQRVQGAPSYMLMLYLLKRAQDLEMDDTIMASVNELLVKFFVRRNLTNTPPTMDLTRIFISFVDEVEDRRSGKHIEVMCAGHLVADKIGAGVPGDYYQHEFRSIDGSFPYPQLTLWQLGIPANDVLHVRTEQGDRYVEMEN